MSELGGLSPLPIESNPLVQFDSESTHLHDSVAQRTAAEILDILNGKTENIISGCNKQYDLIFSYFLCASIIFWQRRVCFFFICLLPMN